MLSRIRRLSASRMLTESFMTFTTFSELFHHIFAFRSFLQGEWSFVDLFECICAYGYVREYQKAACVVVCFPWNKRCNSPRIRQRVVMCQLSCFSKKNQLLFAPILVRLAHYIPLRVLLKSENSSKNLHVRMDNKNCNTNLGWTDQSCHPTWISNRRWHNYLASWMYHKSFKIGLWHSNQSS